MLDYQPLCRKGVQLLLEFSSSLGGTHGELERAMEIEARLGLPSDWFNWKARLTKSFQMCNCYYNGCLGLAVRRLRLRWCHYNVKMHMPGLNTNDIQIPSQGVLIGKKSPKLTQLSHMNTKTSNNHIKYEVLVAQYLCSILDISAKLTKSEKTTSCELKSPPIKSRRSMFFLFRCCYNQYVHMRCHLPYAKSFYMKKNNVPFTPCFCLLIEICR